MQGLSIGKLARGANVSIDTIRFYEKSGLLPRPARLPSGFRKYSSRDLQQLRFIRRGRELGLSLHDIGELLALDEERDAVAVGATIDRQLQAMDRKLERLRRWRECLLALRGQCDGLQRPSDSIVAYFPEDAAEAAAVQPAAIHR